MFLDIHVCLETIYTWVGKRSDIKLSFKTVWKSAERLRRLQPRGKALA